MKIIKIESYYDNVYLKKKCDEAEYFPLFSLPSLTINRSYSSQDAVAYDPNLAEYLMKLSYNVELSNCINLDPVPIPPGFTEKKEIFGTSSDGIRRPFAYIFTSANENYASTVLIIFTGTVFTDEWVEDFEATQVYPSELNGVRPSGENRTLCHEGFYNIYKSVRNEINEFVATRPVTTTIYISGHSLGAALATLCAYDLGFLKPIVYTFASPRVFNIAGAQELNKMIPEFQRVYNTEDLFTTVPLPSAFGEIYEHVSGKSTNGKVKGGVPFTINLGSIAENHTDAYLKFLKEK